MRTVDIIRTSASRPEFLRVSDASWRERLHFSGSLRWLLTEDCLDPAASKEVVSFASSRGYSIARHCPRPVGQGRALTWLLEQAASEYILNIEDDWHLLEDIDLDRLCSLLDRHPEVNQIAFFKRPLMDRRGSFVKKQLRIDGVPLVTDPHWAFTPALWRAAFIKPRWQCFDRDIHHRMNDVLRKHAPSMLTAEWVTKNTGTYFLGTIGNGTPGHPDTSLYVQHLGMGQSRRLGEYDPGKRQRYPYDHPNLYLGDIFTRP